MEEQKLKIRYILYNWQLMLLLYILFFINALQTSSSSQDVLLTKESLQYVEVNVASSKDSIFIKIINKTEKEFKFNTYLQSYGLNKPYCWYTSENDIYFEMQAKVKKMTKLNPMDSLTESVVKISEFYYNTDSNVTCDSSVILINADNTIQRLALIGKLGDKKVIIYSNHFKY